MHSTVGYTYSMFVLPPEPVPVDAGLTPNTFAEVLRLLSAFTYSPQQAEHAAVVLKGQTR